MKYFKPKNFCKAFSLIELSIVILIIGILVAGVTQSSRLVKKFRLIGAQNATNAAPVLTIKDLAVWYEPILDRSFEDSEESDGSQISQWRDSNYFSSSMVHLNQSNANQRPVYREGIINGLPSLKFDGTDDFLVATNAGVNGKGLTAFIVGQRSMHYGGGTFHVMLAGLANGFSDDTYCGSFVAFADFMNFGTNQVNAGTCLQWFNSFVVHPGNNVPFIFSTVFYGTYNASYHNGLASVNNYAINTNNNPFIVDSIRVGCKYSTAPAYFYNGYISEVIIYNRALSNDERKSIESYLGAKYAIKVI